MTCKDEVIWMHPHSLNCNGSEGLHCYPVCHILLGWSVFSCMLLNYFLNTYLLCSAIDPMERSFMCWHFRSCLLVSAPEPWICDVQYTTRYWVFTDKVCNQFFAKSRNELHPLFRDWLQQLFIFPYTFIQSHFIMREDYFYRPDLTFFVAANQMYLWSRDITLVKCFTARVWDPKPALLAQRSSPSFLKVPPSPWKPP